MFHLRFARSFQRCAAKAPHSAPSLREPKRCTCLSPWLVRGLPPTASHRPVVLVAVLPVLTNMPAVTWKSSLYFQPSSVPV